MIKIRHIVKVPVLLPKVPKVPLLSTGEQQRGMGMMSMGRRVQPLPLPPQLLKKKVKLLKLVQVQQLLLMYIIREYYSRALSDRINLCITLRCGNHLAMSN
jgi:hypothetical protein